MNRRAHQRRRTDETSRVICTHHGAASRRAGDYRRRRRFRSTSVRSQPGVDRSDGVGLGCVLGRVGWPRGPLPPAVDRRPQAGFFSGAGSYVDGICVGWGTVDADRRRLAATAVSARSRSGDTGVVRTVGAVHRHCLVGDVSVGAAAQFGRVCAQYRESAHHRVFDDRSISRRRIDRRSGAGIGVDSWRDPGNELPACRRRLSRHRDRHRVGAGRGRLGWCRLPLRRFTHV